MAILTEADIDTIRARLGDAFEDMTDSEVLSPFVVIPIERQILSRFPKINQRDQTVKMAAAMMVAAAHMRALPEISQSRLGDSTLQIAPGQFGKMADDWEAAAWSLITPVVPEVPNAGALLFQRIPGRR